MSRIAPDSDMANRIAPKSWELHQERTLTKIEIDEKFTKYNPGSPGAVEHGCTFPEAENNFGRGRSKNGVIEEIFTADPDCPVHGIEVLLGIKVE